MRRPPLIALLCLLTLPAAASAENAPPSEPTVRASAGARVGGYGFREYDGTAVDWQDCRMNGTGLFGTVDVGRHFFTELSIDMYHATTSSLDAGMDRISIQPLLAGGLRFLPDFWLRPHIQVGGGPEFTRIELDGLPAANKTLGAAFMGTGGELVAGQLRFGTNLRFFMMGLPTAHHGAHVDGEVVQALEPADGGDEVEVAYEPAGQLQFYLRYEF